MLRICLTGAAFAGRDCVQGGLRASDQRERMRMRYFVGLATGLVRKRRWAVCCAGVTAVTYLAVFTALHLPGNHLALNFVIAAFPATVLQFVLIDLARHGYQRRARPRGRDVWKGKVVVTRVIRPVECAARCQPRIMRVVRPHLRQRVRLAEKLGLN